MTRFHYIAILTAILAIAAIALHRPWWCLWLAVALFVVMGFGVAIPQLRLFGPYVCDGNSARKAVALTFDDGPDPRSTPALLALLREAGVPAAFFAVGHRVEANPELAAQIVRDGHVLENHSYAHSNFTNFYTTAQLHAELSHAQEAIQRATGVAPVLFRPPMGLSNPGVFRAAEALKLRVIGWTVRGLDTRIKNPERIVARIVRGLKPGAIILLHDGNIPSERLVITVRTLLDRLRLLGYEMVRLDKLLA